MNTTPPLPPLRFSAMPRLAAWLACLGLALLLLCDTAHAARGRAYIGNGTVLSDQGTLLRGPFIKLWNRTIYTVGSSAPSLYQPAYWQPYKDAGFNNVRIVVAWGSQYPGFNAAATLQALDELVAIFTGLDMYVTICGSANDYNWFHKADLQDQWANIAPRYKDHTNVLYEIQNEPMGDPNGFFSNVTPPKGSVHDLIAIYHTVRAAAPDTIIGMWGFSALGNNFNDALWAIQGNDRPQTISYDKTAVVFHYYPPTQPAYVAALQAQYPVWMTEGSDEGPGGSPDIDFAWYLDCEQKGISWNSMDFQDTLQKCLRIKAYLTAQGYGWEPDRPSDSTLAHHWRLDESSGTNATDSAGGKHGTLLSGAWHPTDGFDGGCYAATALWQRIRTPSIDLGNRYTVAAWINLSATGSTNRVVFSNRDNGAPNRAGVSLFVDNTDRRLRFYTANGSANRTVLSTVAVEPGAWEHVAVTVDNTTGSCRLYLNGVDVTGSGSILTNAKTSAGIALANYWDGGWGQLTGRLDDVRIYRSALGAADVSALALPAPAHHWRLDESSGTTAADSAGGSHGTVMSGAWHPTDGAHGGSYAATALWQRITTPAIQLGNRYTVAAWIKLNTTPSTSPGQVVFSNRDNGIPNRSGVSLLVGNTDRRLRFYTANGSANRTVLSTVAVEPGTWEHVAVTVDNTTGACRLYLNGVDVTGSGSLLTDAKTSGGLALANYWDGGWGQLTGRLDDVRIYKTTLGAADLTALTLSITAP